MNWKQPDLARAARVSGETIRHFEAGRTSPQESTLTVLKNALEAAGVEFTNGAKPGVRLNKTE